MPGSAGDPGFPNFQHGAIDKKVPILERCQQAQDVREVFKGEINQDFVS
jgi:hypothetical protein